MGDPAETATSAPAQVRLSAQDWADLRETMRILGLGTTSEALREAIRLLHREARQVQAAQSIAEFYADAEPPLPVTDALVTEADLAAADRAEW
ncbi:hypothetical protein [Streptomyces johnsoniae]|uniref:Ribbon-helix-helix protein CopG domain-containing protein n=1 Tax=Streptomyces johnsoniae TaxID=3075532 RepID=A0ABU2RYU7_9ACTN|nr:hypothetical protein [Streptomyces sp. DSM 41886]MDT0441939.1 hypothetical protein [Streptomyces sp. DSM 41886]